MKSNIANKRNANKIGVLSRDDLFSEFMIPFDRLFDDFFRNSFPTLQNKYGGDFFVKGSYPKVDIRDTEESIVIEAAVPGMSKEDISIEVEDGILKVAGSKSEDDSRNDYIYRELKRSSFRRSWNLSDQLDHQSVKATFENGMLNIEISKLKLDKRPNRLKIEIE